MGLLVLGTTLARLSRGMGLTLNLRETNLCRHSLQDCTLVGPLSGEEVCCLKAFGDSGACGTLWGLSTTYQEGLSLILKQGRRESLSV